MGVNGQVRLGHMRDLFRATDNRTPDWAAGDAATSVNQIFPPGRT